MSDDAPTPFANGDPAILAARAASFGGQARAYARARPDYPIDGVRWALEPVTARVPAPRVLDLGAGTGKLTEVLLRALPAEAEIFAVEPDPNMLAQFRRLLPRVRSEPGSAEAIPLHDHSVDAIVVGQALHWFDLARALPEMARVLTPGGVLAGLWNLDDDRVPWVHVLKATAQSSVSVSGWEPRRLPLDLGGHFDAPEAAGFPHRQRRTAESMVDTVATHSHVLILSEPDRAALLDRVRAYLLDTPETRDGEFDLPIVTTVLRTTVR